jgi:Uma2 family endonuclease
MGLALRDTHHHTYADYLTWPESVRYELVDGQAYLMSPAPTIPHQEVVGIVYRQLGNQLEGQPCTVLVAPVDVRLPKANQRDEDIDTVLQPDVLVVCDPTKLSSRGVRGAPDWVLEVVSRSTAAHDQVVKRRIYEQAGVCEYWIVHPTDRVLTAYTLGADHQYGRPDTQALEGRTKLAVLPGVSVDWATIVERLATYDDDAA